MKFLVLLFAIAHLASSEVSRIVGGSNAEPGKFPYQVSLRLNNRHFCGGSIINELWILTAAHCVENQTPDNMTVVTGTNVLSEGGDVYKAEKLLPHPRYSHVVMINDIALIKVADKIALGDKVQTIALPAKDTSAKTNLTLSGWGLTFFNGSGATVPDKLQTIETVSIDTASCRTNHIMLFYIQILPFMHICTLTKEGQGACMGDSGGPLVEKQGDSLAQVGVVSWGTPCAKGRPDVFTKVLRYVDWIKTNTQI